MAGLDGIARQIDPGEAMDRNLYDLPPEQIDDLPTVCRTLEEALDALDQDRGFLLEGEVFTDDVIDAHIALKRAEIEARGAGPPPGRVPALLLGVSRDHPARARRPWRPGGPWWPSGRTGALVPAP